MITPTRLPACRAISLLLLLQIAHLASSFPSQGHLHAINVPAHSGSYAHRSAAATVCSTLAQTFPDKVNTPTVDAYTLFLKSYYSAICALPPTCIFHPTSAQDVSAAVKLIGEQDAPFAVRSGGHSTNIGAASTTGVLISMDRMNTVTNVKDGKADIGPGARWGQVYFELEPYGVTVIGGRMAPVGVGGLLLGGGISYLSAQYGFAIDNVRSYELVLPNATITTVTETSNPDLWFALRGGGDKFGIVTKFTLKTRPQTLVEFGLIYYDESQIEKYFAAVADFTNNNKDPKAAIIPNMILNQGNLVGLLFLLYDAPKAPENFWTAFTSIPAVQSTFNTMPYFAAADPFGNQTEPLSGARQVFRTATLDNVTPTLTSTLYNISATTFKKYAQIPGFLLAHIAIEPIERSFLDIHASKGPAALTTPNDGPQLVIETTYTWATPELDAYFQEAIKKDVDALVAAAHKLNGKKDNGSGSPWLYANYAQLDQPLDEIYAGKGTLQRLRGVQRSVDREGLFRKNTGGFQL
ncbi:hypothetical protein HK104_011091 [Borealophlyctis nickersoniae]|nr:hypothetical protein HK104_011091 [Borealophlyctis nickersoniae]